MIRPGTALRTVLLSAVTTAALLCFAFPDGAGAFDTRVLKKFSAKDLKKQRFDTQSLMTFNVPLQVSSLPPAFSGGKVIVDCMAYFMGGNQPVGIVLGRTVREGIIGGGSFQGTVGVPGQELMGTMAGDPMAFCIAMVEKGGACMALGAGCSDGDCGGSAGEFAGAADCSQNVFEQILGGGSGGAVLR